MPSVAMTITMDKSNGTSFMVRVYRRVQDIGKKNPTDCWEVSNLKVDDDTMDYLEDNKLTAAMIRRHKTKEAKNHVATTYEVPGE